MDTKTAASGEQSPEPRKAPNPRIRNEEIGVTGGRGVAALYIFAYHALVPYWAYLGIPVTVSTVVYFSPWSFVISGCGIDFFFVLSAYLLSKKMTRGDYPNLRVYYLKRIFRIWPMYYVAILILMLFGLYHPSWLTFVFAMNYFPKTFEDNQLWVLIVEELFYLILPFWILLFVKGRAKYALPIMLLITSLYRVFSPLDNISYYDKQIPSFLFDYALGTALGLGGDVLKKRLDLGRWKYGLPVLFIVFASFFPNGFVWFSHPAFASFYLLMLANFSNSSFLTNRVIVFLGRISFPFALFGTFILTRLDGDLYASFAFSIGENSSQLFSWLFASVALTFVVAVVAHYLVENTSIDLGRKVISRFRMSSKKRVWNYGIAAGVHFGPVKDASGARLNDHGRQRDDPPCE